MKVLVVDDELGIQRLLKEYLESKNCEVVLVGRGDVAFQGVMSNDFDLIFLDLKMPGWSGMEALKALDKVRKNPNIVVMSGNGVDDDVTAELAKYDNVLDFIAKPFEINKVDSYLQVIKTYSYGG